MRLKRNNISWSFWIAAVKQLSENQL